MKKIQQSVIIMAVFSIAFLLLIISFLIMFSDLMPLWMIVFSIIVVILTVVINYILLLKNITDYTCEKMKYTSTVQVCKKIKPVRSA